MKSSTGKTTTSKKTTASEQTTDGTTMERSLLLELFENGLKDIYWAEKALVNALPKMAENATSPELVDALETHLQETEGQVTDLERVFELIDKKPVAKKCDAMEGLIKEGEAIIKDTEEGPQRDAGIIAAAQKVEHYEIATYGTLSTWAETLGLAEASEILAGILDEEKNADETLTEIAVSTVNVQALQEEEGE